MFKTDYVTSFLVAILLHAILFGALAMHETISQPKLTITAQNKKPIINAVTVNQIQVDKQIKAIKQQQAQKKANEQAELRRVRRLAEKARKNRIAEQKRIAKLKAQKQKIEKANNQALKLAKNELNQLKQKKQKEKENLEKINKQAEKTKKQEQLRQQKLKQEKLLQQQLARDQKKIQRAQLNVIQKELDKYTALLLNQIKQNWNIPPNTKQDLKCVLAVSVAKNGSVLSVRLVKSSGDPALDRSAQTAVWKSSPLPVPKDQALFNKFREIRLTMQPKDILSTTG